MALRNILMAAGMAIAACLSDPASSQANPGFAAGPAPSGFVDASGDGSANGWGSFYSFRSSDGAYGGQRLAITHDDGVSVYAYIGTGGEPVLVPGTSAAPGTPITDLVTLPSGTTRYKVVHNGPQSEPPLRRLARVPEPATWTMIILGFAVIGHGLRRAIRRSNQRFEARIRAIVEEADA